MSDAGEPDPTATDHIWRRDEPDSPCQKVCMVHPTARLCIGCHRTPDEIAGWARYTPERRAELIAELPGRAHLLRNQRPSRRRPRRSAGGEPEA